MKRFFLLLAVLFLFSCRKEENKSGYYNRDGSPVTWEQARDITEHLWSMFDYAFISMDILPSSTRIIQRYADQVSDPYYSPAYDSWVVVMSPDPRYINGFRFYRYVFVNAKTGEIFIDSIEREVDKESIRWREIKSLPQNEARQPKYPAKTKSTTATEILGDTSNKWAVIISGGGTVIDNHSRYWNDCSAMYSVLVNKYGYQKSHIYLSVSDGTSSGKDMNFGLTDDGPFYSSLLDYDGFVCNV